MMKRICRISSVILLIVTMCLFVTSCNKHDDNNETEKDNIQAIQFVCFETKTTDKYNRDTNGDGVVDCEMWEIYKYGYFKIYVNPMLAFRHIKIKVSNGKDTKEVYAIGTSGQSDDYFAPETYLYIEWDRFYRYQKYDDRTEILFSNNGLSSHTVGELTNNPLTITIYSQDDEVLATYTIELN